MIRRSLYFLAQTVFISLFSICASAQPKDARAWTSFAGYGSEASGLRFMSEKDKVLVLIDRGLVVFDMVSGKESSRYNLGIGERPLRLDLVGALDKGGQGAAVTSVSSGRPSSYIFSIDASGDIRLLDSGLPYFLRVLEMDGRHILIGQRGSDSAVFAGGIFELSYRDGKLMKLARIDLPRGVDIYEFAPVGKDSSVVWVRIDSGHLMRYQKEGKGWQRVYRSTERYKGSVKCFYRERGDTLLERRAGSVCVSTPPVVVERKGEQLTEQIFIDDHDFLLGGVVLAPPYPKKVHLRSLLFDPRGGMRDCKGIRDYEGWIGDYFLSDYFLVQKNSPGLVLLINGGGEMGGPYMKTLDVTYVDCNEEF